MAKVLGNGRAKIRDEDFRHILQQLIDADRVPPGIHPGYVQSDLGQGGRCHAGKLNGAAHTVWSHEKPVDKDQGAAVRVRSALQGLTRSAQRAVGLAHSAWVWSVEMARTVLANKWCKRFDRLLLFAVLVWAVL